MALRDVAVFVVPALASLALTVGPVSANGGDQQVLLNGVKEITSPCCLGPLVIVGGDAFPVVLGKDHEFRAPVVAAARAGTGRVVAFGHAGYLSKEALGKADGGRLVANAVAWTGARLGTPSEPVRVGVLGAPDLVAYLQQQGFQVEALDDTWLGRLGRFDVLCLSPSALSDSETSAVAAWVRSGHGLLAAEKGGDWLAAHPGKTASDYPGNALLRGAGIHWAEGDLGRPEGAGCFGSDLSCGLTCADKALGAIAAHVAGTTKYSPREVGEAAYAVMRAVSALPPDDTTLRPAIVDLLSGHQADFTKITAEPVTEEDPLARLALGMEAEEARRLPAAQVVPSPAAEAFPGPVPTDAPRVTRTVEVDTAVDGWHSTGLYAAPGELITVEAPTSAADRGLRLRIGAHSDTLWHLDSWERAPDITRTFPIAGERTAGANAFGGPIYVEVPEKCGLGVIRLTITNAVEAPYYVLGKTDPAEWRSSIRLRPAPWAELEGRNLILTVPSSVVRDLNDPEAAMAFWDEVLDADAGLASMPRQRQRPERICTDVQISAGYMHSGYPIMAFLDVVGIILSPTKLCGDHDGGAAWGFFHELGHNHQSSDWNFEGTGEVTCNLFTLYDYETVCDTPAEKTREQCTREWREEATREYLAAGASFTKWQEDPFLGLIMYQQLKEGFGWDAFKRVFAEYRSLPADQKPKTDDERRDQWMVRFSRAVGRNLGPFFQVWGIPTSEQARQLIADLPGWIPEGFPPQQ